MEYGDILDNFCAVFERCVWDCMKFSNYFFNYASACVLLMCFLTVLHSIHDTFCPILNSEFPHSGVLRHKLLEPRFEVVSQHNDPLSFIPSSFPCPPQGHIESMRALLCDFFMAGQVPNHDRIAKVHPDERSISSSYISHLQFYCNSG